MAKKAKRRRLHLHLPMEIYKHLADRAAAEFTTVTAIICRLVLADKRKGETSG
jgi:hypothetical protein